MYWDAKTGTFYSDGKWYTWDGAQFVALQQ
jgi:hypothetical protein